MTTSTPPTVFPGLRYRDAAAAIETLCKAFGFETGEVVTGDDRVVHHAELRLGNGMVMLGQLSEAGDDPWDLAPSAVYAVVEDPDAHHDRAVAAGMEILLGLTDTDYGSRNYTARDPEGTVWTFGTYQPFASPANGGSGA